MTKAAQSLRAWWQRAGNAMGFHMPIFSFALRTALASFLALCIAQAAGLEHPHWAAMSVWASSQPTREHLLSRGVYRFAGSVVGVTYAVALVLLAQGSVWVVAIGLAGWGALCAFWGNLQRGYLVYGCMLAGYSAVMVALLHHGPADAIWPFALDRLWTVVCGVLTALCVSWCFAPQRKATVVIGQSRLVLAQVLHKVTQQLQQAEHAGAAAAAGGGGAMPILRSMAEVEALLELYPEGSRTARTTANAMHWQQHCALELLYQITQRAHPNNKPWGALSAAQRNALAQALQTLEQALKQPLQAQIDYEAQLQTALEQAIFACETAAAASGDQLQQHIPAGVQALHVLLQAIQEGRKAEAYDLGLVSTQLAGNVFPTVPLHKDWTGAKEAALRSGAILLVFGLIWAASHSSVVGFGMLGLSTMLLIFSAFENPARSMAFVLRGQIIGASLALFCQIVVWPWAHSSWQMIWLSLPFALLGGIVFAHKRTAAGAMDTNMAMFILLAPTFPVVATTTQDFGFALAVVSGPALAWIAFRFIYPTNAQRRMRALEAAMLAEIPALAHRFLQASRHAWLGAAPSVDDMRWQARLHHRLLHWVRWAEKTKAPYREQLPDIANALRGLYGSLWSVQQWHLQTIGATPTLRRALRCAQLVLQRTAQWDHSVFKAQRSNLVSPVEVAWKRLAEQNTVPPHLRQLARHVAQFDWPQLIAAHQLLDQSMDSVQP